MDIAELIKHPEQLDRDTLYELRSMLALYPYFQTARLLMLQNLYLLHDPTFDEELRRAAIYITDRKVIFNMIEAAHYQLPRVQNSKTERDEPKGNRTISLINSFLETIPKEEPKPEEGKAAPRPQRKPTPADAAVDYVAYLIESTANDDEQETENTPQMAGQELIDSFINTDKHKIVLSDSPQLKPQVTEKPEKQENGIEEGFYTETLARIYIKQGNYSKALQIIRQLSLDNPKKNAFFADQIRFLEKLIINNNKKNK